MINSLLYTTITFSQCWYWFVLAAIVCYFMGCFNFAVIISHFKHKDIRTVGSGNPGTMNMTRTFGFKIGVLNFFCDGLKCGIPVIIAWAIFKDYVFDINGQIFYVSDFARYFFGIFVIIGHIFPVTMKFKGGKGIAATLVMFWCTLTCEYWWFFFVVFGILVITLVYIIVYQWGSMGSLFGVSVLSATQLILFVLRYEGMLANPWVIVTFMLILAINLLTWIAHRKNIYKLLAGEEHRTIVFKHHKKA